MNYILLVDEDDDVLNIQQLVLSSFYAGEVVSVNNSSEALERLEAFGEPELIVGDHNVLNERKANSLYAHLVASNSPVSLIICSGDVDFEFQEKKYPHVSAFLQKPFSIESLTSLVKGIVTQPSTVPDYIQVKLSVLVNFIGKSFDLYLRLSETNFVKYIRQDEDFTKEDSDKLIKKGVTYLYITAKDSLEFLKAYEENLNLMLSVKNGSPEEQIAKTIDAFASIEGVSKALGWSPEVVEAAKQNIDTALKILSKDAAIVQILNQKLADKNSPYSRHVSLQTYLCCVFSMGMPWGGQAVQVKLALASLLHDLSVDESFYADIKNWNLRAADPKDRSPEVVKYRMHPIEASKFIRNIKNLPPDIDQILVQHHEKKDGQGFPRALNATRISQLSVFFNIIEDLVEFIGDGTNVETSLTGFKIWGDCNYDTGHYKKTYDHIKKKI